MAGAKNQDRIIRNFDGKPSLTSHFDDMETKAVSLEFGRFRFNFEMTLELISDVWALDPMNGHIPLHSIVYREAFLTNG